MLLWYASSGSWSPEPFWSTMVASQTVGSGHGLPPGKQRLDVPLPGSKLSAHELLTEPWRCYPLIACPKERLQAVPDALPGPSEDFK